MAHPCYVCTFYPVPDGDGVECPHCHRLQYGNTCPRCGQNSPTVIKGLKVVCGACGAERGPLGGGLPMNIAGKPSKVGGAVAKVFGWSVAFFAAMLAAIAIALYAISWPIAGTIFAFPAAIATLISWFVLRRGSKLSTQGDTAGRHAREQALFALAANRGGIITAADAAAALNIQLAAADALLTAMAREGTHVGVELDGAGIVHYVFKELRGGAASGRADSPVRVEDAPVRVDAGVAPLTEEQQREQIRAKVDREFEQMRSLQDAQKRQG